MESRDAQVSTSALVLAVGQALAVQSLKGRKDGLLLLERVMHDLKPTNASVRCTLSKKGEGETHVDKVVRIHDALDQSPRLRALGIDLRPLASDRERLVLPGDERHGLDDGRLNDLLAREDSPRDGVGAFALRVGAQVLKSRGGDSSASEDSQCDTKRSKTHSLPVDGVVGDMRVSLDPLHEGVQLLRRDEELEVGLEEEGSQSTAAKSFQGVGEDRTFW